MARALSRIHSAVTQVASREGAIMTRGLMLLPTQTQLLFSIQSAPAPCALTAAARARFAARARRDLIVALPWVPIFALVPGSVLLFSACASAAPALLPSTFQLAREKWRAAKHTHTHVHSRVRERSNVVTLRGCFSSLELESCFCFPRWPRTRAKSAREALTSS